MSKINVIRRCYSCGAILQNKDPKKEGYIGNGALLSTGLDRVLFCDKCYKEASFHLAPHEPTLNSDMLLMMKDAVASDALILYVVDLFSFEASFSSQLSEIIKGNKILVLANKRDLLPSDVSDEDLKEYVAHRFRVVSLPVRKEQVLLTSLMSGTDIKEMIKRIDEERRRHDVYIIGAVGSGKSLFFSSFLHNFSNASGKDIATTTYPGTSLSVMQIPLDSSSFAYDTPGTSIDNSLLSHLELDVVKKIVPTVAIKGRDMNLEVGSSLLLGGLGIIQLVASQEKKESITTYFPPNLSLKKLGAKANPEEEFTRLLGKGSLEPTSNLVHGLKDLDVFEIAVDESGSRDIGIEGLGWFSFRGNAQTWRLYVPKGVSTYASRSKIKKC